MYNYLKYFVFLPRKTSEKRGQNEHNHRQKPESLA